MSCQHILNLDNFPFLKMLRPDFDRFGAWFTMGNINLHLINGLKILVFLGWANHEISISGRPCVHPDDDLIVSHFAIDIGSEEKMDRLIRFHLVLLQQCMALVMWRKFRVDLKPENHLRWEQFCYNGSINRRLDELGVAYRENVSVPKGSGGAGKVLVCFDEKKYLSDNVW